MHDSPTSPKGGATRSGLSRRQVVKVGANVAWTAPLIAVATAAPAFAVSGQGSLATSYFSASIEQNRQHFVLDLGPITNTGSGTTGQVTVAFRIPKQPTGPFSVAGRYIGPKPKGWALAGVSDEGGAFVYSFVSYNGLEPDEATPVLNPRFKIQRGGTCATVQISATASAPNATPATTATTLTCPAGSVGPGGSGGSTGDSTGGSTGGTAARRTGGSTGGSTGGGEEEPVEEEPPSQVS